MNLKISIIIPAYNAERYIEECIKSILDQTYKNFELIIVNDGSIDKTKNICEKYQSIDSRIIIVNKENNGVSAARNSGLDIASGEYVMFIDADDWIDFQYLEHMINNIENADIIVSSFKEIYEGNMNHRIYNKALNSNISGQKVQTTFAMDCIETKIYTYLVWGKLYKKTTISNLRFLQQAFSEDAIFVRDVMLNCKLLKFTSYDGYYYRINKESVTNDPKRGIEKCFGVLNMNRIFYMKYVVFISKKDDLIKMNDLLAGDLIGILKKIFINKFEVRIEVQKCISSSYNLLRKKNMDKLKRIKLEMLYFLYRISC